MCVCASFFFFFFLGLVSRLSCASHTFSGKYNSQILQLCLFFNLWYTFNRFVAEGLLLVCFVCLKLLFVCRV